MAATEATVSLLTGNIYMPTQASQQTLLIQLENSFAIDGRLLTEANGRTIVVELLDRPNHVGGVASQPIELLKHDG